MKNNLNKSISLTMIYLMISLIFIFPITFGQTLQSFGLSDDEAKAVTASLSADQKPSDVSSKGGSSYSFPSGGGTAGIQITGAGTGKTIDCGKLTGILAQLCGGSGTGTGFGNCLEPGIIETEEFRSGGDLVATKNTCKCPDGSTNSLGITDETGKIILDSGFIGCKVGGETSQITGKDMAVTDNGGFSTPTCLVDFGGLNSFNNQIKNMTPSSNGIIVYDPKGVLNGKKLKGESCVLPNDRNKETKVTDPPQAVLDLMQAITSEDITKVKGSFVQTVTSWSGPPGNAFSTVDSNIAKIESNNDEELKAKTGLVDKSTSLKSSWKRWNWFEKAGVLIGLAGLITVAVAIPPVGATFGVAAVGFKGALLGLTLAAAGTSIIGWSEHSKSNIGSSLLELDNKVDIILGKQIPPISEKFGTSICTTECESGFCISKKGKGVCADISEVDKSTIVGICGEGKCTAGIDENGNGQMDETESKYHRDGNKVTIAATTSSSDPSVVANCIKLKGNIEDCVPEKDRCTKNEECQEKDAICLKKSDIVEEKGLFEKLADQVTGSFKDLLPGQSKPTFNVAALEENVGICAKPENVSLGKKISNALGTTLAGLAKWIWIILAILIVLFMIGLFRNRRKGGRSMGGDITFNEIIKAPGGLKP